MLKTTQINSASTSRQQASCTSWDEYISWQPHVSNDSLSHIIAQNEKNKQICGIYTPKYTTKVTEYAPDKKIWEKEQLLTPRK